MITVERIADGRFDSGLKYAFTDQGAAFGNIGEWLMFADASQLKDGRALNRAVRQELISAPAANPISIGSLNGFPAFRTGTGLTQLSPPIFAPQGEWSAIFVVNLSGTSNVERRNVFRSSNVTETDPDFRGLNIFIGGSNGVSSLRLVAKGGGDPNAPIRISYSGGAGSFRNKSIMGMITFSTVSGLKLFINGELKASRAEDVQNLTAGSAFTLFPTLEDGLCPEILLNGRDLSLIPGAVAAVSNFYIAKYDLTPI